MSYKYLILGLLMKRPMTGYDIRKHVKADLQAVSNASYGTLYPALHKLLAAGEVDMHEVPQVGRPAKKVYRITRRGEQALASWLRRPPAADQVRREFLLKLYLAQQMSAADVRALLTARRHATEAHIRDLTRERETTTDPQRGWVLDYALAMSQAELTWLARLEAQLNVA